MWNSLEWKSLYKVDISVGGFQQGIPLHEKFQRLTKIVGFHYTVCKERSSLEFVFNSQLQKFVNIINKS
jgi:hypothetical protein